MIDLLQNSEIQIEAKNKKSINTANATDEVTNKNPNQDNRVDINRYQDLEGISIGKLQFGFWFVKNRKKFVYLIYAILILIGLLTLPRFFYTFGYYIIKGMKDDRALSYEYTKPDYFHSAVIKQGAQQMEIQTPQILPLPENRYDIVSLVKNPNKNFWGEFDYYFLVDGTTKLGPVKSFILPEDSKYLFKLGETLNQEPNRVELYVENLQWKRINQHDYPDWSKFKSDHLNIETSDIEFVPSKSNILSEKLNLNELKFKVKNHSGFNYWEADLSIVFYNQERVIAINKYSLFDFRAGEQKDVVITWPGMLAAVEKVSIVPDVNILDNKIYNKIDGGTGESK